MIKQRALVLILLFLILIFTASGAENALDWNLRFPYSASLATAGDISQYVSLGLPLLLGFAAPQSQWLSDAATYGTAVLISYGMRTILKGAIDRPRPYTHQGITMGPDDLNSFPSGHSAFAFTSAAFLHTLFWLKYPDSPWRTPLVISGWSIATATAALRVLSGNHYLTDVLGGAAIGVVSGVLVPLAAKKLFDKTKGRFSAAVGVQAVAISLSY